ncbi:MAG: GNAT family N-acetyltransferase [Burkholderiaceae bacterium]
MTAAPAPATDDAPPAPVNVYTEPAFLQLVADVYHAGRACRVRDFAIDCGVYRLLEVEGVPQTTQRFIDLHESLGPQPLRRPALPRLARLEGVAAQAVPLERFKQQAGGDALEGAPTVQWDGFRTWADYLALLQARRMTAEDLRRGRRLQEHFPDLEFAADDRRADVLPMAFEWKTGRDLALGREPVFADARHVRFFEALRERGMLRASTLRGGGRPLALWLGAVHDGRWSGWIFAFNPDAALARYSLGQQLLYRMLEHSHGEGHREFDFSIGMEPYKLKFATHVRPIGMAGRPSPAQRAGTAMRHWLVRHPRLHETARALRRRISPAMPARAGA